ncbi:uncharacterized protein PG998_009471 [Apiospora kogelbergensis]|uniref:uncharacterized protein n=1 Tax=Apiospora kogelbergensis TaxID=1337665 RepID=UPI00313036FF
MNTLASRGPGANGYDGGGIRPLQPLRTNQGPKPNMLIDGYRQEAADGDMRSKPRYNPMNSDRIQSSVLVDLKDPVQVHLLTETAILDSKQYEILAQEEVDALKKQCQLLNQRIDQTRSSLAIQSKYRDAAVSMARLYSPNHPKRKSLLGNRASGGDAAREAEAEREAIQKKMRRPGLGTLAAREARDGPSEEAARTHSRHPADDAQGQRQEGHVDP